jgi:hypothetical protein
MNWQQIKKLNEERGQALADMKASQNRRRRFRA